MMNPETSEHKISSNSPLAISLGAGILSALFLVSTLFLPLPLAFFCVFFVQLPLFAVGLSGQNVFPALGAAVAALSCLTLLGGGDLSKVLMGFGLWQALPILCLTPVALRRFVQPTPDPEKKESAEPPENTIWLPESHLLVVGILLFLVLMGVMFLGLIDNQELTTIKKNLTQAPLLTEVNQSDLRTQIEIKAALAPILDYLPGLIALSGYLTVFVNLNLAQNLLTRKNLSQRPGTIRLYRGDLPSWLLGMFIISGFGALTLPLETPLVGNIFIVLMGPYLLKGVSLIHALAQKTRSGFFLLGLFYFLALSLAWPFLLILAVGLLEPWLRLETRGHL